MINDSDSAQMELLEVNDDAVDSGQKQVREHEHAHEPSVTQGVRSAAS